MTKVIDGKKAGNGVVACLHPVTPLWKVGVCNAYHDSDDLVSIEVLCLLRMDESQKKDANNIMRQMKR